MSKNVKKFVASVTTIALVVGTGYIVKRSNDFNRAVENTSIAESFETFGKENGLYDYFYETIVNEDAYENETAANDSFFNEISELENWLYIAKTLHEDGVDSYSIDYNEIDKEVYHVNLDEFEKDYMDYLELKKLVGNPNELSDLAIKFHKQSLKMKSYSETANANLVNLGYERAANLGLNTIKVLVADEKKVEPYDVIVNQETSRKPEATTYITVKDVNDETVTLDSGRLDTLIRCVFNCQRREKTTQDIDEEDMTSYNQTRIDTIESLLVQVKLAAGKTYYVKNNTIQTPDSNNSVKAKYYENIKK